MVYEEKCPNCKNDIQVGIDPEIDCGDLYFTPFSPNVYEDSKENVIESDNSDLVCPYCGKTLEFEVEYEIKINVTTN